MSSPLEHLSTEKAKYVAAAQIWLAASEPDLWLCLVNMQHDGDEVTHEMWVKAAYNSGMSIEDHVAAVGALMEMARATIEGSA